MWHMGGVEGGKVQNHWQMTDPHSGADRGQAWSAQLATAEAPAGGVPQKVHLDRPAKAVIPI